MADITTSFDLQAASKRVGIVGTMDTKGLEFEFIKTQIESAGISTCVINTGILGEPELTPDVSADEVAQASRRFISTGIAGTKATEGIASP